MTIHNNNQVTSNGSIVIYVDVAFTAAVGNNAVSVTANALKSNSETITLNGPNKMIVQSDLIGPTSDDPNAQSRYVEYQVQNFDNTPAASIPTAESITLGTWNCQQPDPGHSTAQCNARYSTDSHGYFTDEWGMYTGYTPATCGVTITDHWQWCAPPNNNPPAPNPGITFGTLTGFLGVSSTTINGKTNPPNPMPASFVINP